MEYEFQGPEIEIGWTVFDLKNLVVKLQLRLVNKSGAVKKCRPEMQTKQPVSINNLGQDIFQSVEILLNSTSVSSSNNLHPYWATLDTDLSHEPVTTEGILRTQKQFYEPDPSDIDDETESSLFDVRCLIVDQTEKK